MASTSKSQAHLNTGASRSKLKKELKELLDLAKNITDESVFQQENRYKKFKAKNHTIQTHELPIWSNFFNQLNELKLHKECIYWCTKMLQDVRLCDSPERLVATYEIVKSFYYCDDFENVFKYGEKYLAISMQTMTPVERSMRSSLLFVMQDASRKLNRIDEFQYPKEILKLNVVRYNAKEIDKLELLISYLNCIKMQIEIGNFNSVKKTLKHLKMFSLDSMNASDTIKAMENEDYGKVFPLNNLLNNSDEVKDKKKLAYEFCKRNSSDHDSFQLFDEKVYLYSNISKICWQKHEILLNLGEIPIKFEWGYLALNVFHDIYLHLELFEKTKLMGTRSTVMMEIVGITLLLADNDHLNRENLFSKLSKKIYDGNWHRDMFKVISLAQRNFSNLDVQKVMPFLDFCLRSFNEGATSYELNVIKAWLKVKMSTFKNSLTIMNHFGALKNTLAFQPVLTQRLLDRSL